jgi:hypothetical protein
MNIGRQIVRYQKFRNKNGGKSDRGRASCGLYSATNSKEQTLWVCIPNTSIKLETTAYEFETTLLLATTKKPLLQDEANFLRMFRSGE